MRRTGWALLTLACVAMALAGIAAALGRSPSSPDMPAAQAGTGVVRTFTQVLDQAEVRATTPAQWAAIARQDAVVVLNSWDFGLIPVLKRANPAVQVWVYKDLSGVRSDDCTTRNSDCGACPQGVMDSTFLSSGMGYCWLKRHHPGWLLRASGSGEPFQFRDYPHIWETDYGNHAYQRQWIANVLADVRGHGWDGVKLDNALTTVNAYGIAARYPTDAAVQAATYSALQEVGHALGQAGVRSVANVGYAASFPGLWQRWLRPVGGLEEEYYLSHSTRPDAVGAGWLVYENEVSSCAVLHKVCWFHSGGYTKSVTPQTRDYALASLLLATDGRQLLSVDGVSPLSLPPQLALGQARGAMAGAGRLWRRTFADGVVAVNPTRSRSAASLGGTYLGLAGRPVSTVSLRPASGAVLRAVPGPVPHGRG